MEQPSHPVHTSRHMPAVQVCLGQPRFRAIRRHAFDPHHVLGEVGELVASWTPCWKLKCPRLRRGWERGVEVEFLGCHVARHRDLNAHRLGVFSKSAIGVPVVPLG